MSVLVRPLVTEKLTKLQETRNQYTFEVDVTATKNQIRDAVKTMYPDITVGAVNTIRTSSKPKGRFTKGGYISGQTKIRKKAIVTLKEGQSIDFFSEI